MNDATEQLAPPPPKLSLDIICNPELSVIISDASSIVAIAESYTIEGSDMATFVKGELDAAKAAIVKATAIREEFMVPFRAMQATIDKYTNPPIIAFKAAETIYKTKLAVWVRSEQERADKAKRELEEAQRRERQEAERKAAEEQARADALAAEQRRKADDAAAEARKLAENGNARAAAGKLAEAAGLQEKAAATVQNGQVKAMQHIAQAETAHQHMAPPPVAKVVGFSTRKNWKARLKPNTTEQQAILVIAKELATRPELLAYLTIDMTKMNQAAKSQEGLFNVPGFEAWNNPIAASR